MKKLLLVMLVVVSNSVIAEDLQQLRMCSMLSKFAKKLVIIRYKTNMSKDEVISNFDIVNPYKLDIVDYVYNMPYKLKKKSQKFQSKLVGNDVFKDCMSMFDD